MEAKLEKIENSEAYISVKVDADQMEDGLQKAYLKVVKKVNLPGFRKGKVPRHILEAHFGKEVLYEDAMEIILPKAYEAAVKKLELETIASPEIENLDIEEGLFKFNARIAVRPEFELAEFDELKVTIPKIEVTDEDIENRLEEIRSRYAELKEKTDEPAENGDTVYIDFEGFIDGEAFEGGKGEDYPLELGSNTFIEGFEEQLIGVKKGEKKDINVTFPESYHASEFAGKNALFKIEVKKIETKIKRVLDDEFAQEVSQFDTIEQFKLNLRESMEKMAEHQKKEVTKEKVIAKALEKCNIVVAEAAIKEQQQKMRHQFEQRLMMQGIMFDQYLQANNITEEDVINNLKPEAEHILKSNFMLEKLVEKEGFTATDEEIDKQIETVVKDSQYQMSLEQAKERFADMRGNIGYGIKLDKAVNYLLDKAEIEEENDE